MCEDVKQINKYSNSTPTLCSFTEMRNRNTVRASAEWTHMHAASMNFYYAQFPEVTRKKSLIITITNIHITHTHIHTYERAKEWESESKSEQLLYILLPHSVCNFWLLLLIFAAVHFLFKHFVFFFYLYFGLAAPLRFFFFVYFYCLNIKIQAKMSMRTP